MTTVIELLPAKVQRDKFADETIQALELAIAHCKAGTAVALCLAVAFREEGGTARVSSLEAEDGQHIYLLGLVTHLQQRAVKVALNPKGEPE